MDVILNCELVSQLPGNLQSVCIQAGFKLFISGIRHGFTPGGNDKGEEDKDVAADKSLHEFYSMSIAKFQAFVSSAAFEVQERASVYYGLINEIDLEKCNQQEACNFAERCSSLFKPEIRPVLAKVQKRIPIPDGLLLDVWINEPPPDHDLSGEDDDVFEPSLKTSLKPFSEEDKDESKERAILARKLKESNPFYLGFVESQKDYSGNLVELKGLDLPPLMDYQNLDSRQINFGAHVRLEGPIRVIDDGGNDDSDEESPKKLDLSTIDLNIPVPVNSAGSQPHRSDSIRKREEFSAERLSKLWSSQIFLCGDDVLRSKYECYALEGGYLFVNILVAFRPQAEEGLKSVHLEFETIVDQAGHPIIVLNTGDCILAIESAFEIVSPTRARVLLVQKKKKVGVYQEGIRFRIVSIGSETKHTLGTVLRYELKLAGGDKVVKEFSGALSLGTNDFLHACTVTTDEMRIALSDVQLLRTTKRFDVNLPGQAVLDLIPRILSVSLIRQIDFTASFFGVIHTGDGQQPENIGMLVKIAEEKTFSQVFVDMKCHQEIIAASLLSHLEISLNTIKL